ncbi:DEAD2 domain protein [Ancylostoma ceylanicum]|uniref:DEAD2 domain protein n=3 Tax=Ancylostoma ceylanicum TaxID=53326 RepID=A0A0D6LPI6_9BILA|nr:DEAD2 domain protein [Ancylostoma ceylanicum]
MVTVVSERNPWQEPKEENFEEEGQGDSLENVDLVPLFKPKKRKRERVIIDNSQYDKMPICGIEVRLPVGLKPYPSQKLMMVRIITALNKRLNLLAESPTGSGKTMALLASSCAWIQDYKKKRHEATAACPVHSYRVKGTDTPDDDEFVNDFASSPSVQQGILKNGTPPEKAPPKECICLPHTILASREQSCINMAARESRDISAYCRELLSAGGIGCRYKEAMKSRYLIAPNLRHVLEQTGSVVFDIEGLVESLSSLSSPLCPYFSSTRVLTIDADIIFCPFSYLVDPIIRDSSDVRLKHSVVILDEAHNIEDTCREAASFTFYEKEISDSLVNLRDKGNVVKKCLQKQKLSLMRTLFIENTTLKLIEKSSNAAELMDGMEKETANASIEAYSLELERITAPAYKGLVASYQDPKENRTVDNKVGSVALICVEKWLYFIGYFKDENKRSMYKLNVCSEKVYQFHERGSYIQGDGRRDGQSVKNINYSQMTGDESDVWLSSTQGPGGHDPIRSGYRTSFNLWCMCPELAFADAFSECRSVILASGTLCPVETLKTELGLKFHSQMEGEQVIPSEQIFASVLPMVVVQEPRRSSELPMVMEVYESAIRNPSRHGRHVDGALMFAVFRGKVSEGIDFTDDLARLVISVGIPFPNAMDEMVKEKKMYNDEFCKTKAILTGDQWYITQAYRALNQALGRCLRHRNDWGALVLVDERLVEQATTSGSKVVSSARVSTWIRDQLVVYRQFQNFESSLSDFVRRMQLKDEEKKFDVSL